MGKLGSINCIITLRYALLRGYMRLGYSPLYIIMNSGISVAPIIGLAIGKTIGKTIYR